MVGWVLVRGSEEMAIRRRKKSEGFIRGEMVKEVVMFKGKIEIYRTYA